MKIILFVITTAAAFFMASLFVVFVMHDEPAYESDKAYMKDGCVYQKSGSHWIRTCG